MKLKQLLALALFALIGGGNVWADQTPTADGVYYILNVGTQKFLSRGMNYGTRACVDNYGAPVKLIADDGKFKLQEIDNAVYFGDDYWMYADCTGDRVRSFTLTQDGETYKISGNKGDMYAYVKEDGDKYAVAGNAIIGDNCKDEDHRHWRFLSQAERDEFIASKVSAQEEAVATAAGYTVTTTLLDLVSDANAFTNNNVSGVLATNTWALTDIYKAKIGGQTGAWEFFECNGVLRTQMTGLKKGIYLVTLPAFSRVASNATCSANFKAGYKNISYSYVEANGNTKQIADWASDRTADNAPNGPDAAKTLFDAGKYSNKVFAYVDEAGTLDLAIYNPTRAGSAWFLFGNVTVTYYSDQVSDDDATAILAAVPTGKMNADILAALTAAKEAFEANKTIPNYNALNAAITPAKASVEVYENVKSVIDANATKVATLDADGQAAYDVAAIQAAYDNGTITDGVAELADLKTAYVAAVMAQTSEGSWFTDAVVNAAGNEGTSSTVVGWTCTNDKAFHINTWSGEGATDGSGMLTPFIENWMGKGGVLPNATISNSLSGLKKGLYEVTGLIRVLNEAGGADPAGAYIFANASSASAVNGNACTNGVYGTYSVKGVVAEDNGTLTFGIKYEDANFNWVSFKNFTVQYLGDKVSDEDVTTIIASMPTDDMNAEVKADMDAAKDALVADHSTDNYNALAAAITEANKSVDIYNNVKAALAAAQEGMSEAAKAIFATKTADITAGITNGTITDGKAEIAAIAVAKNYTIASVAEVGTELTSLIVNPTVTGSNGWTCDRPNGGNGPLLNSNSFEYWGGNASSRDAARFDYYQVINGLPEGKYIVSAQMYNSLNGEKDAVMNASCGVYANDQICKVQESSEALRRYGVVATVGADGVLRLGVKSEGRMGARWFVADNFMLVKAGTATADIMDCNYVLKAGEKYLALGQADAESNEASLGADHSTELVLSAKTVDGITTLKGADGYFFVSSALGSTSQVYANSDNSGNKLNVNWLAIPVDGGVALLNIGTGKMLVNNADKINAEVADVNSTKLAVFEPEAVASMAVNATAQYGTFVAPFNVTIPAGVKAYTVDGIESNGETLTLAELTTTIPANTPVVLNAESGKVAEKFYGEVVAGTPTEGALTGTYVATPAPANSYVLQLQEGVAGFYKVEGVQPTVGANRCYLTASSDARVLTFGEETAIKAIDALTSGKAEIFDLNGRRLNSLQKGINVVNGVKILVK